MGFQTPLYQLSDYLKWTTTGKLQLPDFQRGYKWEDDRVRQLLVTILRGHPLGVVMLLKTGNDQIRFKPRPVEGVALGPDVQAEALLLDGQQRLTSLTQALTQNGVVDTTDSRGKRMQRRYYVDMDLALLGEDRIDEAVVSMPGDGIERANFGKDIVRDLSTPELEQEAGMFPVRLLYESAGAMSWLFAMDDRDTAGRFQEAIIAPALTYNIPVTCPLFSVRSDWESVGCGAGAALSVFHRGLVAQT